MLVKALAAAVLLAALCNCQRRPPPHHRGPGGRGPPPRGGGRRPPPPPPNGGNWGPPNGANGNNGGPPNQPGGGGNNGGGGGGNTGGQRPGGGRGGGRPVDENSIDTELADGSGTCSTFERYARATPTVWDLLGQNNYDALANGVVDVMRNRACRRPPRPSGFGQCPDTGGKCDRSRTKIQSVYLERVMRVNGQTGRLVITNGIPDHCYQVEAPRQNPNDACEHYSAMWLPIKPAYSNQFTEWPMGAVGVSISGAYFYNHMSAEPQCNVAALTEKPTFDPCDGHADPTCKYHYHKAPVCIEGWHTCGLMGYMMDGVPVYGKCTVRTQSGRSVTMTSSYKLSSGSGCDASHYTHNANSGALDRANGYYFGEDAQSSDGSARFKKGDYAYFFTPEYPFIMPGSMAGGRTFFCGFHPSDMTSQ